MVLERYLIKSKGNPAFASLTEPVKCTTSGHWVDRAEIVFTNADKSWPVSQWNGTNVCLGCSMALGLDPANKLIDVTKVNEIGDDTNEDGGSETENC